MALMEYGWVFIILGYILGFFVTRMLRVIDEWAMRKAAQKTQKEFENLEIINKRRRKN